MKALTRILVLVATLLALATALSACELPGGLSDLIPGKATATEPASTTTAQKIVEPITPSVGLTLVSHGNGTCYVSGIGTCTDTDIVIPETSPTGDIVTRIGWYAFSGCKSLTSIEIPTSVTSIGEGAFTGCTSLTSIEIPSSVTSIGDWAFGSCRSLTSIEIPASVTDINWLTFSDCSALSTVTFAEGSQLTNIDRDAFIGCTSLISIDIPSSVTNIGDRAFGNCDSLTSVTFQNTVGWTAVDTALSSSDLANKSTAAEYLTSTYHKYTWTRN